MNYVSTRNREFENIFKDIFNEQKDKLIEFIIKNFEDKPPKLDIENHLNNIEYPSVEKEDNIFLDIETDKYSKELRNNWNRN
jgi:acyl-ACP thioesterase